MSEWKDRAIFEVMAAQYDPDHTPRFPVPARKWWQFWKPKWRWSEGISTNTMRRRYGLDPLPARIVKVSWE